MAEPVTFFISWSTDADPNIHPRTPCAPAGYVHFLQNPVAAAVPESSPLRLPAPPEPWKKKAMALLWPGPVQIAVAVLILVGAAALAFHAFGKAGSAIDDDLANANRAQELNRPLDLNRAGEAELRLLPGVGPKLAKRIVDQRQKIGKFRSVDDLRLVPGIGPVTFDRLRSRVTVDEESVERNVADRSMLARPGRMTKTEAAKGGESIDVNRASAAELQKIPGVGPVLSQNIVDYRLKNGPFRSMDELCKVKGIKSKMLEKIRPFITVSTDISIQSPPP